MDERFPKIIEFIRKLYNKPEGIIPLHAPVFMGNEKKYLNECIDSTFVSSVGKFVDRFEEMVAEYTGARKAVVTVNGTNALHIALLSVGVKPGDEVITQPLTFIATANAIVYSGAQPVFLDVDRDTMGLSPQSLYEWLNKNVRINPNTNKPINKSSNKSIAACVPMHTFGHPCRIDEIIDVCDQFNIPVVEDAAESLGSFYKDQHTGTFGKLGILSFNGNKTITTGGGGMLLTMDEDLGNHLKHLTTQAKVSHPWEYIHDHIGYNYRMPNINAAIGVAQMEKLNDYLVIKRETAQQYDQFFKNNGIVFFKEPENSHSNYWLNAIILNNKQLRDEFLTIMNENDVITRPLWRLISRLDMFKNCQTDKLINSEWCMDRVINLPSSIRH